MIDRSLEENKIRELYGQLLDAWNKRDTKSFSALYEESGNQIGFDGRASSASITLLEVCLIIKLKLNELSP